MFKAIDAATKMVITTRPEAPIYDAIRIMASRNITGLPVVDADLNVVGVLSEKDVLKLLYDTLDRADQTVADYMSTPVVTLDTKATLIDLCDCLMSGNFRRVPITEDGKLCAIASISDVIQGILRIKRQAP
ncbi:MAG: CBS domain-containing protein [Planctomycetota bacterium]